MAYSDGNLTTLGLAANGFTFYRYDAGDDTFATASAAGYFNNTDDDIELKANDWVILDCSDTVGMVQVLSVSSAGDVSFTTPGNPSVILAYTTSVATLPTQGVLTVAPASAGILYQLAGDPVAGQSLEIFNISATTSATAIIFAATSSVVKFSYGLATGGATLTLLYQAGVKLRAVSATEYRIMEVSTLQPASSLANVIPSVATS